MRVLWVGNSYTYYPEAIGGVPGALRLLAAAGGAEEAEHVQLVRGGASLVSLAADFERCLEVAASAASGRQAFDVVVLQDQSLTPAGGAVGRGAPGEAREESLAALRQRYAPLLHGGQEAGCPEIGVVLYQTWGRPASMHKQPEVVGDFEEMSRRTADGYQLYGEVLAASGVANIEVARVGDAYMQLVAEPGDARLFHGLFQDAIGHPTPAAALLIACVFARTLARLRWRPRLGQEPTRAAVDSVAARLGVASDAVAPICRAAGVAEGP
mmetsp:Transcript_76989/g.214014  ORF Transcript_76989/g.214014 Transcript_76989/m.214014 type:complete len:269 (-) Transcript_76989:31-837(-)